MKFTALTCAIVVSLGGFVFGFDASVISGVVGFVAAEFDLNDWQTGFVVSSPTLGAMLASIVAGALADQIGRKRVLLTIAFLYILSAVTSAIAPSFEVLAAARFIGGMAFASLIIAPIYIAEIAPSHLRGRMVSINQMNIVVGLSAAYFANYLLLQLSQSGAEWVTSLGIDTHTWRWMLGIETIPATIWFVLLLLTPESPRWLMLHGREERARSVVQQLIPALDAEQVGRWVEEVRRTAATAMDPLAQRLRQLLSPAMRFVLIIGLIVGIAQQITGVNAIYFYAPVIFEQSGVGTDAAFAQAVWVGIINIVFTIVAMICIDRFGRKPLLVIGLSGVFVSMTLCAWGFHNATYQLDADDLPALSEQIDTERLQPLVGTTFDSGVEFKRALRNALGDSEARAADGALLQAAININPMLVLIGILGFVASFAVSLGPVMWVLFSEIFPNRIRGIAISVVGVINSTVSFSVQLIFPWELTNLGAALTFLIYGLFAVLGLILVVWLLPETRGKTLEQLETELGRHGKTA